MQSGETQKVDLYDPRAGADVKKSLREKGFTETQVNEFVAKLSARELADTDFSTFLDYLPSDTTKVPLLATWRGFSRSQDVIRRQAEYEPPRTREAYLDYMADLEGKVEDAHRRMGRAEELGAARISLLGSSPDTPVDSRIEALRKEVAETEAELRSMDWSAKTTPKKDRARRAAKRTAEARLATLTAELRDAERDLMAARRSAMDKASRVRVIDRELADLGDPAEDYARLGAEDMTLPREEPVEVPGTVSDEGYEDPRFYGSGVKRAKAPPRLVPFGKYCIHMPNFHKGILRIKYSNGLDRAIPSMAMSAPMQHAVREAMRTGKFEPRDLKGLSKPELRFLQSTCSICKVALPAVVDDADDEQMKRFEMLRGQVEAGNDNPQVVSELRRMIAAFVKEHRISAKQAKAVLLELAPLG
jgi:hypothetical protein